MSTPRTGFAYLDRILETPGSRLAFAHRGGAYHPEIEGLENSRSAFAHAVSLGYEYLETDVHVTRDGVLLAFHDLVLDRVTDSTGDVADLTFPEVRRARIGGREQIPTLAELFDAFPEARFNIDIKADGAVGALAQFIAERDAWDRVLVGSFSPARLRRFRRLTAGRVATSAHPGEIVAFVLIPSAWLADRFTGQRVAALQLPMRRRWRGLNLRVVSPRLIRRAHRAGKHVHVWTIDEPTEMHRLLDAGVDGLMTDRTDLLRDVLVERGQWGPSTRKRNAR